MADATNVKSKTQAVRDGISNVTSNFSTGMVNSDGNINWEDKKTKLSTDISDLCDSIDGEADEMVNIANSSL